ncbi:hypothetical protein CVT26_011789 [Gymnopilus dilepis]|uniref:Uncharacterized protein n=1 Tax=Gymnopilus dilepis TaxID=231916 RepID=A0A409WX17_9AGAR|nr:hypothetical protein CVT26_011789 [Gymnopilus dilepis]
MSQSTDSDTISDATTTRRSYYDVLERWQNTALFEDRITFNDAVELLGEDEKNRVLEAKVGTGYKASTWTMFNNNTGQDAIFVHAAVWQSNSDLYTGNFVPKGEEAPIRVAESRIQNVPNFKCDITYVFNTDVERSLYTNVEHFEDYIKTVDGFNRSNRPRSSWQDGSSKSAYSLSSKLFVKKAAKPRQPNFEPHEWLVRAIKDQPREEFAINPDRPLYFDLVDNKAMKLENSDQPQFEAGDVVWFAFKISFFVAQKFWTSELVPLEFMRVARASEFQDDDDRKDKGFEALSERKCLMDGFSVEVGEHNQEPALILKRKKPDTSDTETASSREDIPDGKEVHIKEEDRSSTIALGDSTERGNKKRNKRVK